MSKPTRTVLRERIKPGIWKRVGKDGKPIYEITYRDSDGKQRRQTIQGGIRAAEIALHDKKARMGKGERVVPNPKLTFAEAAEKWLSSAKTSIRPATLAAYTSSLDTHLLPAWGKLRLDQIDVNTVATLVERMQTAEYRREINKRTGKTSEASDGYKTWTIRGALVPAGRIFDFAKRRLNWAGTNPVRELVNGERPKHQEKDRRILTHDELAKLIGAADEPYRTIIATAAYLGTRLGETLGLRWRDIDLDDGTATIRYQCDRAGKLVPLKTARSRRVIEMPGSLVTMLREHKIKSAHSKPDDLVFVSRTGSALEHRNVAQRGLAKACKTAKLDGRGPTFHELRHTHASAWIANGGDIVELSARLGHGDPSITARVYSHEFEAAARSAQRRSRLDSMYGSPVAAAEVSDGQSEDIGKIDNIVALQPNRSSRQ